MSRKPFTSQLVRQSQVLTVEQMKSGIGLLRKRLVDVESFDPNTVTDQFDIPQVRALTAAIEGTLEHVFGANTSDYRRYQASARFDNGPFSGWEAVPISTVRQSLTRSKNQSVALLKQAMSALEERCEMSAERVSKDVAAASADLCRDLYCPDCGGRRVEMDCRRQIQTAHHAQLVSLCVAHRIHYRRV